MGERAWFTEKGVAFLEGIQEAVMRIRWPSHEPYPKGVLEIQLVTHGIYGDGWIFSRVKRGDTIAADSLKWEQACLY